MPFLTSTLEAQDRAATKRTPPMIKIAVTPRLALFTFASTLAYLGLAVLGWGGFSPFFSHPARIAVAIILSCWPARCFSPKEI